MLHLLLWWTIGLLVIFIAAVIHIVKAVRIGYEPVLEEDSKFEGIYDIVKFLWGLTIWPIRLAQFIDEIPERYTKYKPLNENKFKEL